MQGIVSNKNTKENIAYANIVSLDKDGELTRFGTSSAENGTFELDAPYGIAISVVGYETLFVKKPSATNVYYLEPKTTVLEEIEIVAEKVYSKNKGWMLPTAILAGIGLAYMIYNSKKK